MRHLEECVLNDDTTEIIPSLKRTIQFLVERKTIENDAPEFKGSHLRCTAINSHR